MLRIRQNRKIILSRASLLRIICYTIIISISGQIFAKGKTERIVSEALSADHCVLNIENIGKERIHMLLAVEDPNFYGHKGVDCKTPGAGLTTISQGLVKYFYFKKFKPGIAKIKQTYIARYRFHPKVSKDDQLTLFYNYVYLGNDDLGKELRGFEAASQFYFKKGFSSISDDEYLVLVAMLINPNKFRIDKYPERNQERVKRIKKLLAGECSPTGWRDCNYDSCL